MATPSTTRFNYAQGQYRDVFWLVLFLLHLGAMVVGAALYGPALVRAMADPDANIIGPLPPSLIGGLVVAAVVGTVFGMVWLGVMKACAGTIIKLSIIMNIALLGLGALACLLVGQLFMGLLLLFMMACTCFYFYWVRNRIAFAQAIIKAATSAIQDNVGTVYTSYFLAVLQVGWVVFWTFAFAAVYFKASDGNVDPNNVSPLSGFITFVLLVSLYWTAQVLKNIGHVTTAGSVASWWLAPDTPSPTCGALSRALTTSLGSICFGSLIVALLQATRAILRQARNSARRSNNIAALCALACAECLLSCIESLVEFFNMYAYTQVAIYGKDFVTAAKDTWALLRAKGFELIINDDLTGMVLSMGCLLGGVVGAAAGTLYVWVASGKSDAVLPVLIAGFLLGFFTVLLMMAVVQSAVATTYVVWAEDPSTMQQQRPKYYQDISTAAEEMYPGFAASNLA